MMRLRNNEQGMVSMLVTMIMIMVISLIVLGFAQVTRRNQREALNNQLSVQAYYAAESGVNMARKYFTYQDNGKLLDTTGNCTQFIGMLKGDVSNNLLGATNVRWSCLMVNNQPTSLVAKPLAQDTSVIWNVATADGKPFTSLTFTWTKQSSSAFTGPSDSCDNTTNFPAYGVWNCAYGILRVDLVDGSSLSSNSLESGSGERSLYLVPTYNSSGSNVVSLSSSAAQIVHVKCNAMSCTAQLDIAAGGSAKYYARITTLYQGSENVTLTGSEGSSGAGAKFQDGQLVVDSTGQAQDELRRIRVRIPLNSTTSSVPAYGVASTDSICKQLEVAPGFYQSSCP